MRSVCLGLSCAVMAAVSVAKAEEPKVLNWVYKCQPGGSFGAQFVVGGQQGNALVAGAAGHRADADDERIGRALRR